MKKIRMAIAGYGNLGRGAECAIAQSSDLELVGVFTRRDPAKLRILTPGVPVLPISDLESMEGAIDVLILCGGSATDLPVQSPKYAKMFNMVDSFDNHAKIPEHFAAVDAAAQEGKKVAIISVGWDPGLFSLIRGMSTAVLPDGSNYTFWGKGVSQGHSDAIRRLSGVIDARQYTIPVPAAMQAVRTGVNPELSTREKHTRECFVVAEEGADLARIEHDIVTMPNYFDAYDTTVHFVSADELKRDHSGLPHGGTVLRSGKVGWEGENNALVEFKLELESNPEFTSAVLVAYARAAHRISEAGQIGCKTIFDVPVSAISSMPAEEMRRLLL